MTQWPGTGPSAGYLIDDDPRRVDRDRLFGWLSTDAYWWSGGLDRPVLERAVDHSLNLSVLAGEAFVGFARLVTDRASFAYLADVYVDAAHRGRGLGGLLTRVALAHPELATCRRFLLATADAHQIYERAGFAALARPDRFMEVHRPAAAAPPTT
jgi:GNAT superfamily N-acetyltransferase